MKIGTVIGPVEATMPVIAITSVTRRPPHSRVSTIGKPPRSSPISLMPIAIPANVSTLPTSALRPVRTPPPSTNSTAVTITVVRRKSPQTGSDESCN